LIFHYIVRYAGCTKPVERLWLQSMTPGAILDSFKKLKRGSEMQNLTDAATSRAESDWLVGINGSRVLTLTDVGNRLTPVGRVQTPTLAMVGLPRTRDPAVCPEELLAGESNLPGEGRRLCGDLV